MGLLLRSLAGMHHRPHLWSAVYGLCGRNVLIMQMQTKPRASSGVKWCVSPVANKTHCAEMGIMNDGPNTSGSRKTSTGYKIVDVTAARETVLAYPVL